jgi:hypothetical protein
MAANSEGTASISQRGPGRRFTRGTSGNPNGRPKVVFEIRDLAREFGAAGIEKLAEMAGLAPGTPADAEAVRVAAIKELLDRGYGKATLPISGDTEGPPLSVHYTFKWADALPEPEATPAIDAAHTSGASNGNQDADGEEIRALWPSC